MLLKDLLKTIPKDFIDRLYKGGVTNNDNVLAISTESTGNNEGATNISNYAVVQDHIEGIDSNFNPTTTDKVYIRSGTSTVKTGTQRGFTITGDRVIGDEFQDFVLSNKIKYGTGEAVIVDYIYFSLLNGAGETGKATVIVNSDGSGNAEDTAAISVDLKKTGATPKEINILDLFTDWAETA